jgi:cell division protein FtsW
MARACVLTGRAAKTKPMRTATYFLFLSAGSLMAFGMIMLYSAAMVQKGAHYLQMQATWGVAGLIACWFMASIDYRRWKSPVKWRNLSIYAWAIAVALLVLVLIFGVVRNNSRRWFDLGIGSFQPSEAAKLALILFIAWYADNYQRFMSTFTRGIMLPMGIVGLGLVPLFIEPDRGTTILLALLLCAMLVLGGARWWQIVLPILLGALFLVYSISNDSLRSDRIRAWMNPEKYQTTIAYQQWQSMLAIGHGGAEGLGLGNGRQKLGFLPEHHTDFIYSVVAEELGLYASLAVILGFMVFVTSGIYIAWHADDLYGFLIASGTTFLIGMQSLINLAVVTNLVPNKGMSLPFMSYGGSNLLVTMAMVGLLMSVASNRRSPVQELEAEDLIEPEAEFQGA